jgi:hypothetical protein
MEGLDKKLPNYTFTWEVERFVIAAPKPLYE